VVEVAGPLTSENIMNIAIWCGGFCDRRDHILVRTLVGALSVPFGWYVIKSPRGDVYPCRPDIYEDMYEPYLKPSSEPIPLSVDEKLKEYTKLWGL
jgi:hypothetical protein